jgi:hypothetical protein
MNKEANNIIDMEDDTEFKAGLTGKPDMFSDELRYLWDKTILQ